MRYSQICLKKEGVEFLLRQGAKYIEVRKSRSGEMVKRSVLDVSSVLFSPEIFLMLR